MNITFGKMTLMDIKSIHTTEDNVIIIIGSTKQTYLTTSNVDKEKMSIIRKEIMNAFQYNLTLDLLHMSKDLDFTFTQSLLGEQHIIGIEYIGLIGNELMQAIVSRMDDGEISTLEVMYETSDGVKQQLDLNFLRIDLAEIDFEKDIVYLRYTEIDGVYTLLINELKFNPLFVLPKRY